MKKTRNGFGGMEYLRLAGTGNDSQCDDVLFGKKSPWRTNLWTFFTLAMVAMFCTNSSFAASLSGLTVTLCADGYADIGSQNSSHHCEPYAQGSCDAGYYELPQNSGTFIAPENGQCRSASFGKYTTALDIFDFTYTGVIIGSEITLCDDGYSRDGSTCTSYDAANCDSGNYKLVGTETAFVDVGVNDTCDTTGFTKKLTLMDSLIYLIYNGVLVGSEITLCDNGYSTDSTTCSNYTSGYCPTGYFNLDTDDGFMTMQSSGSCASNYGSYNGTETCGYNPSMTTCLDLCENGLMTTEVGTCASMCTAGGTTLRTSTGIVLPLWSTAQSTPSINIGLSNGVCYVNLEPGTGSGINIQYGGNTYHAVR